MRYRIGMAVGHTGVWSEPKHIAVPKPRASSPHQAAQDMLPPQRTFGSDDDNSGAHAMHVCVASGGEFADDVMSDDDSDCENEAMDIDMDMDLDDSISDDEQDMDDW